MQIYSVFDNYIVNMIIIYISTLMTTSSQRSEQTICGHINLINQGCNVLEEESTSHLMREPRPERFFPGCVYIELTSPRIRWLSRNTDEM